MKAARAPIPATGKKYPPKSPTLEATMLVEAATLLKSAMFSIMLTLGASRATKAGPTTSPKKKKKNNS